MNSVWDNDNNGDNSSSSGANDNDIDPNLSSTDEKNDDDKWEIPPEINDHLKLFGKEAWEVEYGEKCPECSSRIDEYGFCSCGSFGD